MVSKNLNKGILVISLDFELYWGSFDKISFTKYKPLLLGARKAIPRILDLFKKYNIHATWATVGFLFFEDRNELKKNLPAIKPDYLNKKLNSYHHINDIGINEKEDPFRYGLSLIKLIASYPYQEIGSHTFSHYYCLEKGQNAESFKSDLQMAIKVAQRYGFEIKSLIFPRNQINNFYLKVLGELGFLTYRGTENFWTYSPKPDDKKNILERIIGFLDSYINISGRNCYTLDELSGPPFNIPSSGFLRSYRKLFKAFEYLKLRRILKNLDFAAKNRLVYHLWWHPCNFGDNLEENISFLEKILAFYSRLKENYGMESSSMGEIAQKLITKP